ncbi:hypothetical protein niasHS_014315 [Heterodera schachtii]|uniref:Uncharacterized protein n=1 Tax=Heterodera schachtii TaxID=97005 RepID=A0ABD2IAL7_HETSC
MPSSPIPFSLFVVLFLFVPFLPGCSTFYLAPPSSPCVSSDIAKICGEPSVAHYFECCGDSGADCCLRLNTWSIVLVSLLAFCLVACLVLCFVKCICLCCL